MSRRWIIVLALGAAVGGCGHVHVPYLPGDRAFENGEADDAAAQRRIDPVQAPRSASDGKAPPCKFGGVRCPPWERAWPAGRKPPAGAKVNEAGDVVALPKAAR